MVAIPQAVALLGAFTSLTVAQTVEIFLPEYGRYEDSLVAENVGENAGVTTYLVGCGPQTVASSYCVAERTGVARDNAPPLCTGDLPYNTYTQDSCVLTAGATLLESPSTIVFIDAGDDGYSVACSAAGTVSAVCTQTFTDEAFQTADVLIDTISGSEYAFYTVPLTTGLTANGPFPTLQAGGQVSTTSVTPSTTSTTTPSPIPLTSTTTPSTSTPPSTLSSSSTTPSTTPSTTASSTSESVSSSVASSSGTTTSSSLVTSSSAAILNTTTSINSPSITSTLSPTYTGGGATCQGQWMVGAAAAAVAAVAAAV